eukprot:4945898-Ditylum_brightwellii.AAC.1
METAYLKQYLEFGYASEQLQRGSFVPSGIYLTSGEAVYKGLLCQQNAWLDCMSVVRIEGLLYDAMLAPV